MAERRLHLILAGALTLASTALGAEEAGRLLDEPAFAEATEGGVYDVWDQGVLRQREAFLPDGRVRLGFVPDGQDPESRAPIRCVDGQWYMQGDAVCFDYTLPSGQTDGPHCWRIFDLGEGRQRAESAQDASELILDLRRTETPLICRGPEIGV